MTGCIDYVVWNPKVDHLEGLRYVDRVRALERLLGATVCRRASTSNERSLGCSLSSNNSPASIAAAAARHGGRHDARRSLAGQKLEEASEAYPSEEASRTITLT